MRDPRIREKRPNNCHVKRYEKRADRAMPAVKIMEAMS